MTKKSLTNILKLAIKLALSIALVWWILQAMDGPTLIRHLKSISVLTVVMLITCMLLISALQAWRWRIVLRDLGTVITLRHAAAVTFLSAFFSQTLPSTIGGDIYRVWAARRSGATIGMATNSVIIDRAMGFFALLFLGAVGVPRLLSLDEDGVTAYGTIGVVCAGFGFAGVLAITHKLPNSWTHWMIFRGLMGLSTTFNLILRQPRTVLPVAMLSLVIQLGFITVAYIIGWSLDPSASFGDYLVIMPVVFLATSLPISIAGWGVREGAMVVGLGLAGISADMAFAISILLGGLYVSAGLIGALIWFVERKLPGTVPS